MQYLLPLSDAFPQRERPRTAVRARSYLLQGLLQIGQKVVDVFHAYRQAHRGGGDVLLRQFFGGQLRVGGGIGMDDKTLHIGHVGQQREDAERVDKAPGFLLPALHLEGKDTAAAVRQILPVEFMAGMGDQGGMADAGFAAVIRDIPEVTECHNISGRYDYLLKINAPDMKYYQQFLLNVLGTIEHLDSLESTFVMDELKQHYGISL